MRRPPPQLLLLAGITSVQFGAAFANRLFDRAGPGGVVFERLLFSALLMMVVIRPKVRGRSRESLGYVLAFGLVLGAMNWSFYEALARLPIGVAVTVEFTGPLAVAIAGSRRALDAVWVVLAGGGVVLLALRGDKHDITLAGVALALVAAACWASYILLSKRVGARFAQLDGLALALCVGAAFVLPAGVVQGGSALLQPAVIGGGVAVAVLSSIIPYSLELIALRTLSESTFGLLMSLEPAVAAVAGVLVLGQALHAVTLVAIAMVVTASVGTTLAARRPAVEPQHLDVTDVTAER